MKKLITILLIALIGCTGLQNVVVNDSFDTLVYEADFSSVDKIMLDWDWQYPWGNKLNGHYEYYSQWENIRIEDSAAVLFLKKMYDYPSNLQSSGMLYYKGIPFQYGRFEATIECIGQYYVPAFWLLSELRYKNASHSILPEIDVAEFGVSNAPDTLNMAVHWGTRYDTPDKRQSYKWLPDTDGKHTYAVEVRPDGVTYYLDGEQVFSESVHIDGYLRPIFTVAVPNWVDGFAEGSMLIHSFKVYQ